MDFDGLYLAVLKYLGYRPRSEKEIRDYLERKLNIRHSGEQSDDKTTNSSGLIESIIQKLKEQKFLNDEEFARMWVRSRTQFKPKGNYIVRLELQQKGISQEIIDEVLDSSLEDSLGVKRNELELAIELLDKKRLKFENMGRQERFNKAGSMLARRGFSLDEIRKAIDQVFGK